MIIIIIIIIIIMMMMMMMMITTFSLIERNFEQISRNLKMQKNALFRT